MATPDVLVLTGYGINCDEETQFAFEKAGARAERVHINDLIDGHKKLSNYQILAFPGGFSYGDDTGAGAVRRRGGGRPRPPALPRTGGVPRGPASS